MMTDNIYHRSHTVWCAAWYTSDTNTPVILHRNLIKTLKCRASSQILLETSLQHIPLPNTQGLHTVSENTEPTLPIMDYSSVFGLTWWCNICLLQIKRNRPGSGTSLFGLARMLWLVLWPIFILSPSPCVSDLINIQCECAESLRRTDSSCGRISNQLGHINVQHNGYHGTVEMNEWKNGWTDVW